MAYQFGLATMKIAYSDIELAVDFSSSAECDNGAYISLDNGKIYWVSDTHDSDELPDDFEVSDRYLLIPPKDDLLHGQSLVREFVAANASQLTQQVREIFSRRGAYRRFKDLLNENSLSKLWHEFEYQRETAAITGWCRENGIELTHDE